MALGRGLRLVGAGVALGIVLTLVLGGSLSSLLFGVAPADLRTQGCPAGPPLHS